MSNIKSKLTLIVDGNWLLMSRKSVMDSRYNDEHELVKHLKVLMCNSINVVLRTFPMIDNIMFVGDGGSWRADIDVPSFLKKDEITYKGNRKPDPNTNWDIIFEGYSDFIDVLKENNINVYKEKGIEGDDWCWYLSKKLNSEGTNCIIWSKDHDLIQLVKTDSDGCFTVWYESSSGLYMEDKDESELNFLFNMNYSNNEKILGKIIKACKKVNKITPSTIMVDKIIRGDAGDNILPIIKHKGRTSDKEFRVSVKELDYNLPIYDEDKIKLYITNIMLSKPYIGRIVDDKPFKDVYDHFVYNRKMVVLDEKEYPDEILNVLKNNSEYECNRDISVVENILTAQKNGSQSIFETI